ncbi:hypothetical protein I503_05244 [Candida albicans SC5314]|uniref:Uncharacterized protein n=1 Tax=Candida albicans P78048 TaxID=1094989 RepID=A0AB34PNI1_CANAX|nr:hypothetical protein MG3_05204 [Candida albicans P78048]KGR09384.1 hypothetical protein MG9_05187 [Candida albicans P37037]KGT65020.1 hypothetical protein MEK_05207 [Candida albicans 12C]KGU04442.1 hypothetical protein MEY_05135 [Candida albicans 19F]KHC48642.1 hypothetical protein MGC_05172 [Candida albicans P37039]KHC81050.1 hypothetical protein I503_05244 [Candida albicans SC5314]
MLILQSPSQMHNWRKYQLLTLQFWRNNSLNMYQTVKFKRSQTNLSNKIFYKLQSLYCYPWKVKHHHHSKVNQTSHHLLLTQILHNHQLKFHFNTKSKNVPVQLDFQNLALLTIKSMTYYKLFSIKT